MNPILALIIANTIWGAASPIFKYSLTNIPPFTLAFIRFFSASFIFLPFLRNFKYKELTASDWFHILAGGFFGITINITFFFLGLQRTESINAPVIASTGPLFLFLFSVVFLKEKPKLRVFLGMVLSFMGILLIVFSPILFDGKEINEVGVFEGNLMLVVATLGSVMAAVCLKKVLEKVNPLVVTFFTFFTSSLLFVPFIPKELSTWSFSSLDTAGWTGILFGVFFSSALACYLYYYGLSRIRAQEVGVFTYIDPIVAVIIAIPLLHEYPNLHYFIGSFLVFAGIFISERRIHYHPVFKIRQYREIMRSEPTERHFF